MNDWQYLSLGNLEQKEFFPKSKSWGFLVPWRSRDMSRERKLKMKEIGELIGGEFTLFG